MGRLRWATLVRNFLSSISKAQRAVELGFCIAAAGVVMVMMFPVTADVILRYVFRSPLHGSLELGEFMMIGVVYLSIAYIQAVKGHIRVEVGTARLPKKFQIALDILGYGFGLALFSIITWRSGHLAWEAWITGDYTMGVVRFPLWPAKSIVPIGTGLLCLRLISDIIGDFIKLFRD